MVTTTGDSGRKHPVALICKYPIFTTTVNYHILVNIGRRFEAEALRILRGIPGLTVAQQPAVPHRVDAIVQFAGRRTPVAVEFKARANAATAWQLVHRAEALRKMPLLLVARETTAQARTVLEAHGIAVVDGLGNAHIELPGLLLHLEGRRRPRQTGRHVQPTRLQGKAGIAAQALLLRPERAWKVRDLADEAQISVGLAHRVLARLEREGVMAVEGAGPNRVRRMTDPTGLLDLWAEENVDRPIQTRAYLLAQTPGQLIQQLGVNLNRSRIAYALTGAAAGSLLAPLITAVPVVAVWAQATAAPEELCEAAGADSVADGQNLVLLQARDDGPLAFREQVGDLWVANRFRLYADLRRDPRRGREQADHLRQEVIGF